MRRSLLIFSVALLPVLSGAQPQRFTFPRTLSAPTVSALAEAAISSRSDSRKIHVFVTAADNYDVCRVLEEHNITPTVAVGNLACAIVQARQILPLGNDDRIAAIDAGSEVKTMSDIARIESGAEKVLSGTDCLPYDGNGVIVGMIDTGFDFLHSAFMTPDGKCRIQNVWDQNIPSAHAPEPFGYGTVYDSPQAIASAKHDFSGDTHGTHVAAIATSSSSEYGGMAPGASIAIVSTDRSEAGVADALAYLIDYADKAGKPLVVNLSLGSVTGFKDGNDNLPYILDGMLEGRRGCAIAIAAGNEGHRKSTLLKHTGAEGTVFKSRLILPSHNRESVFIGSGSEFSAELSIHSADGSVLFTTSIASDATESIRFENLLGQPDGSSISLSAVPNPRNGATSISAALYSELTDGEYWEVKVSGKPGRYIICCDYGELDNGSRESTIASTACGFNSIAVGAYVTRTSFTNLDGKECTYDWILGEEYPLSGKGPTADGRHKPDIMAPGAAVVSAINSYAASYSVQRADIVLSKPSGNKTDYWGVMSGTSMATPVVSGIIALWMQACPELSYSDIQDILSGMDKIDAAAGLKSIAGIENTEVSEYNSITGVYDITGRPVGKRIPDNGIYIVRYANGTVAKVMR